MAERLDKILSSQGVATRSIAQRLIRSGKVSVNGAVVRDPSLKFEPADCEILLEGKVLNYKKYVYIMMNKPSGLLCVSRDNKAPTVMDLLTEDFLRPGLFPAGRLDKDTVGLVIITNDGDFGHRILSPKKWVAKRYHAIVDGPVGDREIEAFSQGITLEDGTVCRPAGLKLLKDGANPMVEVEITEGKYHQVKRMFLSVGRRVLWLKRVSIGKLQLDERLREGEFREMTEEEKALIFQ